MAALMPADYADSLLGELCFDPRADGLREGIVLHQGTPTFGEAGQKLSEAFSEVVTHVLERTQIKLNWNKTEEFDYTPIPPRQGPSVRVQFMAPSRGMPASYEFEDF